MSAVSTAGQEPAVLLNFLSKLGLKKYYPNKLTLQSLLEINKKSTYEKDVSSVEDIPWCFLRKLFQINADCRCCTQLSNPVEAESLDLELSEDDAIEDNGVNPLDLTVALFLCADSLLQQEMALKMSMCQFAVPLVLPIGNNSQCTLMLWALRDIVKEWCPHDLRVMRGFVEDNIVQAKMPLFSFVKLKNCSLSKSQILNQVLSYGQQNQNMFTHREMEGGALERKISNGLVEVCWSLPCGKETLDIFPEPVAFANLRGDISGSLTQFNFLFQVSTATFVFLDKVEENEHMILTSLQDVKSKLFLVVNCKMENVKENMKSVERTKSELDLPGTSLKIKKSKVNVAEFSKKLCDTIKTSLVPGVTTPISIVNMCDRAVDLGLSVDESKTNKQEKQAAKIMDGIEVLSIPDFKKQQLHLQGDDWRTLSRLEKEECRMTEVGVSNLEEYKSQLQAKKQQIRELQSKQKLSRGMEIFLETLRTSDKQKRDYFLKWMKFKTNTHSLEEFTLARNLFKMQCEQQNVKLVAKLDKAILNSSLGIEHYMREMGLIYEASLHSRETANKMAHLPGVAAEMLLDGYALELLDGDASNIPERWVTDVLMELHWKVGERSRLLVLTVLGVQSTGKSTLLNTMFGVQFPVSSGRCTRGAFMLFLRVGADMQSELKFDFILLIDTEGLKSSDMVQLEESCEHDNQLATFVIGLSDIIIVNIAMENSTEMRDVLQIAAHAFLRMKHIGKKPVCHFVHQNVAGVSAHGKTMTEKKHLLDQLNEMTNLAAEMENQPSIKAFTDVLDYDIDKNNWNVPGLWHGTPPMAPVNRGYSEAVADFKKNLLRTAKGDGNVNVSRIPEFLEWMRSLWRAVKYENFIFSFRNTLVAHAYDGLCKEFSKWEWEFRKEILSWQTVAELRILNADSEVEVGTWNRLTALKKCEVSQKIEVQQKRMESKLHEYYRRKDKHVNLIEKYKSDFINSIKSLANEVKHSTCSRLDCQLQLKMGLKKVQEVQREARSMIEQQVIKLMNDYKESTLTDTKLTEEFEKMWTQATGNIPHLKGQDVPGRILIQLRKSLPKHNLNEKLHNADELKEMGKEPFKTTREHVDTFMKKVQYLWTGDLQKSADSIIEKSKQFVLDKTQKNCDYQESFSRDLLAMVDESLQQHHERFETNSRFDIDLKLHICGFAAREFLHMHQRFMTDNDPRNQLEKHKSHYLKDFLDLFKQEDHCQRKVKYFIGFCIKPQVEDYISRSLGIDIVDEMLTSSHSAEYSSRLFFQYNIQKELLQKGFESFIRYIREYEEYVKDWIVQQILQKLSQDRTLFRLKNKNLQVIVDKITEATEQALIGENGVHLPDDAQSISKLIRNMRRYLIKDVLISEEAEKTTVFQIQSTCHSFAKSLIKSLGELKKELQRELSNPGDITATLNTLPIKPQDELFKQIVGCGEQCPFCKVPCEAGGKQHEKHHAAIHRPQGLGSYKCISSDKLVETLCTTDVSSKRGFRNTDTNQKLHPYRKYSKYYPNWLIPPDSTLEASNYWKYVLVKYNEQFAEAFNAKPADVPECWRSITEAQALKGLKDAFNIK